MGHRLDDRVSIGVLPSASTQGPRRICHLVAMLGLVGAVALASEASAQCSARDNLRNQAKLGRPAATAPPKGEIRSYADVPKWKTITLGAIRSTFVLRNSLDEAGCGIGDRAGEILARPAFALGPAVVDVDLVILTAAELGLGTGFVRLADLYARARQLGFELASAEVGPQLRLQYFEQPIGEFLHVGMDPIRTWAGEPVILAVANGGAGLILIGQDGRPDLEIGATSRFVFVRPRHVVAK